MTMGCSVRITAMKKFDSFGTGITKKQANRCKKTNNLFHDNMV